MYEVLMESRWACGWLTRQWEEIIGWRIWKEFVFHIFHGFVSVDSDWMRTIQMLES
jgi:hypothetical protein